MKHIIYGASLFMMTIIVLAATMLLSGRASRANEVDRALDTAIEQTVDELQEENTYTLENKEEFLADFVEGLLIKIESDSEIEVQVAGIDVEKGLLSVRVIEHFKHPNGNPGTVEAERTVVLENYSFEQKDTITITYKVGNMDYKVYTLTSGSNLPVPAEPEGFRCWKNEDGQVVEINNITANQDMVFYAEIN